MGQTPPAFSDIVTVICRWSECSRARFYALRFSLSMNPHKCLVEMMIDRSWWDSYRCDIFSTADGNDNRRLIFDSSGHDRALCSLARNPARLFPIDPFPGERLIGWCERERRAWHGTIDAESCNICGNWRYAQGVRQLPTSWICPNFRRFIPLQVPDRDSPSAQIHRWMYQGPDEAVGFDEMC